MSFLDNTGVTRLVTDLKSRFAAITHDHAASDITSGTLPIARGGTGAATHTSNAVLTGNGTSAVNNVTTADGALYATAANGAAQFGTLPIAQGGTAGTTEEEARTSLEVPVNSSIADVESTTATTNHAIGDYFMLDDKLKTATAAIATGETINATNSADATVQSQIDTLRDSVSFSRGTISTAIYGTNRYCQWVRFGRLVYVTFHVTMPSSVSTGWHALYNNLPFQANQEMGFSVHTADVMQTPLVSDAYVSAKTIYVSLDSNANNKPIQGTVLYATDE